MAAPPADHLRLDRSQANLLFSSWRLSSSISRSEGSLPLPAPAAPAEASDTDYVTARHAALLNGLTQQPAGCYTFLEESDAGAGAHLGLYQLDLGEPNRPPGLREVCALPAEPAAGVPGGLASGRLPPSAVEVQAASLVPDSHAAAAPASGGDVGGSLMLVSSGCGDVSLIVTPAADSSQQLGAAAAQAALSPAVHPLRPLPPLQGVRPVHLAAAFVLPSSAGGQQGEAAVGGGAAGEAELCCILWAARPRSERQPSRCEVFAVHLAAGVGSSGPALRVLSVQLLKSSSLPPHGVLVNPDTGGVLLALQPSSGGVEDQAAAAAAAASTAAAGGKGVLPSDEMEEDDVSPRTLAAAVARLAAYTSEEPVGLLPHQQYADLYHETGPDGVGAMGSEPTCTLYTFALARGSRSSSGGGVSAAAGAAEGGQQQGGQQQGEQQQGQGEQQAGEQQQDKQQQHLQPLLRQISSLSCQPHKLLTCHLQPPLFSAQEPPTPDTHLPHSSSSGTGGGGSVGSEPQQQPGMTVTTGGGSSGAPYGHTLLLGLTDDVDCAVVSVSCSTVASSGSGGSSGGAAEGCGEGEAAGFVIRHVTSIPALAYVAAGKVQRKFLLLAPPGGDIAAALVEAGKYCYLYRATGQRQEHGEHQVVDMELPDGSGQGLLGAVLTGARAGACRLVLLARDGLRVVDM